jgi:hypothetical protein
MLHVPHLEMIDELARQAPALATRVEQGDPTAAAAIRAWLTAAEELFGKLRRGGAARFAALRLALTAEPDDERRGGRRRAELGRARAALTQGIELVEALVAADRDRLRVAEEVALAVVVEALGHGVVPPAGATSHEAVLRGFWAAASSHPEVSGLARQLLARTGPADALALIDRALARR